MIEASIKLFGVTNVFKVDNYRLDLKTLAGRARVTQEFLLECERLFVMLGFKAVYLPAFQRFNLQLDLLRDVVMNPMQAHMFNEVFAKLRKA